MKKIFLTMASLAVVLAGVTSCAKDEPVVGEEGTGNLLINFTLDTPASRAIVASGAMPATSWANITSLMILFTDGTTVKDAQTVELHPSGVGTASYKPAVLTDVKAGNWTAYLVANLPSGTWTPSNVIGKTLSEITVSLPANAAYAASDLEDEVGGTGYGVAPELFVAMQANVDVAEGTLSEHGGVFALTRVVSQIRIRVDQDGSVQNSTLVDFKSDGVFQFAIRRAKTTYALNGTYSFADATTKNNVFFSTDNVKTANPTTYVNNLGVVVTDPFMSATDDTDFWQDYLIWPGGAAAGAERFDIVVSGMGKAGYVPAEGTAETLTGDERLYWDGAVNGVVVANNILELNIVLSEAGGVTPPEVGTYGNLQINVGLTPWAGVTSVPVPF